jgi:3-demethoxyubiquinol 3-hydroxylase
VNLADRVIHEIDGALRTLTGQHRAQRPSPAEGIADADLEADAARHAAGLMRVNHTGEICAQALYQGAEALARGGSEFPEPVKQAMTLLSRVMTETTYRI